MRRRLLLTMAIAALAGGIAIVIYNALNGIGPGSATCGLKRLTGYDCPGCGAQRAINSLLHGHIGDALRYNAALLPGIIVAGLYLWSPQRLRPLLFNSVTLIVLIVAIIAWWIGRNIVGI